VILDQDLERPANTAAYRYLAAHGVHVRWGRQERSSTKKTLTIDRGTSVIMTGNLVSRDYPGTRDFAVIDTGTADVAAIVATFDADFGTRPVTPPDGTDLVWSPTNAQASILSVIDGAARTLAVEEEEMDDPAVTSALEAAAQRGVRIFRSHHLPSTATMLRRDHVKTAAATSPDDCGPRPDSWFITLPSKRQSSRP